MDGARDACADGLVEGALSAARLSLAREGAGADAVEAIEAAARRDAEAAARRDAEVAARRDAEAEQRRNAEALSAARAEAELRRQSSEQHKDEGKELRQTVRDLKGTIGTQRALHPRERRRRRFEIAIAEAPARLGRRRGQGLQNRSIGGAFAGPAERARRTQSPGRGLRRRRDAALRLSAAAAAPAAAAGYTNARRRRRRPRGDRRAGAPTVASDFDAELLGACRKHHLTGRWRVVARRLKLWRIVQTAHALREHCDAPTPVASPVAEEPSPVMSPARTEEMEPAAEPSPASTEEEPSPTKTEPSSQPLSLSAWASAAPSLPKTPPTDTAGALGALDAWASRRSPEPAASASPELALGAFSSRKSLESPARSPRKQHLTSCCVYGQGAEPDLAGAVAAVPSQEVAVEARGLRGGGAQSAVAARAVASLELAAAVVGGREPEAVEDAGLAQDADAVREGSRRRRGARPRRSPRFLTRARAAVLVNPPLGLRCLTRLERRRHIWRATARRRCSPLVWLGS